MRPRLRFMTCGSVDDGKSTLLGRLLHDSGAVFDDELDALKTASGKLGQGDGVDLALLLDGLEAEREQGITIDVSYRYFSTANRAFIAADAPGHEQYTRNMATAASNSELAVILVDARKGLLTQTLRHATIASLMGIRHVLLAVNKMDLVSFDQAIFDGIAGRFSEFAAALSFKSIAAIPLSARDGDNVVSSSARTPWYQGRDLRTYLEAIDAEDDLSAAPFRLPVQWINRPVPDFRGYAGTIAGGTIRKGDPILVSRSKRIGHVARIILSSRDVETAAAGDSVTLLIDEDLDVARGDLLADARHPPRSAAQFAGYLIWLDESELIPGRPYIMKAGTQQTHVTVTALKHQLDVNTLSKHAARTLALNQIGFCNFSAVEPVQFDPYTENRTTGGFILVDRYSNATVAAGMIAFDLRRDSTVPLQQTTVTAASRSAMKHQRPAILWFTGLSGAGKSTIANLVDARLNAHGVHTYLLDGDNIRHGLNKDLGFTEADRAENIRRAGEVAKLMLDAGLVVLCSFISPFRAERQMVRELVATGSFVEVFVDTPIEECIARDPKGLYKRALAGEIKNFTGLDQPYEAPDAPEIHLATASQSADASAEQVIERLRALKLI